MGAMKLAARKLALLCGATLFSLGLAECGFRIHLARDSKEADETWRDQLHRMNSTIYRRSDDPALVYEPAPNTSVPMPYGPASFGAQSMRAPSPCLSSAGPSKPERSSSFLSLGLLPCTQP